MMSSSNPCFRRSPAEARRGPISCLVDVETRCHVAKELAAMEHLTIALLGHFAVMRGGEHVTGFTSVKVRGLLAYLVLEAERAHSRDALAMLLWPDLPGDTARTYLRQSLANLR